MKVLVLVLIGLVAGVFGYTYDNKITPEPGKCYERFIDNENQNDEFYQLVKVLTIIPEVDFPVVTVHNYPNVKIYKKGIWYPGHFSNETLTGFSSGFKLVKEIKCPW